VGGIHVHEFMSLDGVIDERTWTFDYGFDPQMGEAIGAVMERSRGILLGRTTYEMFEPSWSTRTVEDEPGAPFFNDTTKYVVSATFTTPTWRNSEIIGPYDPEAIRSLKDEVDGDLYTSGSGTLAAFVLIHGAGDVGWYWHLVAAELNARGHEVVAPIFRATTTRLDSRSTRTPFSTRSATAPSWS
jgi:dihydrofolate reductase